MSEFTCIWKQCNIPLHRKRDADVIERLDAALPSRVDYLRWLVRKDIERGTCEVEGYDDGVDEGMDGEWFNYAPPTWYLSCGHTVEGADRPRYCSVCGARVKGVDE